MKSAYSVSVTKRNRRRLMRLFSLVGVLGLLVSWIPVNPANAVAGQLSNVHIYLSRQQAGLASGVTMDVFIKPGTSLTGATNKLILTFPSDSANNTKWCRTAGTLTLTAEGEPSNTTQVTAEGASNILGTVTGACTQTPDTFTISAVGALQAGTVYGVKIASNGAVMGTGDAANNIKIAVKTQQATVDTDSFTAATSLIATDQYTVSASIDPTLTVALSATTVNLGTLTTANVSYQGVTSTVTTNARTGYVSLVSNSSAGMTNGVETIAAAGGTVTNGTSGYGASTSASTQTIGTSTATPSCSTTQQSSAGTWVATALTTTLKQFGSSDTPKSAEATTLCFLAAIGGTQAPGSYSDTVTLVTTAKF